MKNVFDKEIANDLIYRLNNLSPESRSKWGKMNPAQMLAHCNITYEMIYENSLAQAKGIKKLLLNWFVKPTVVNEKSYKKNSMTAPIFKIIDEKIFETQKQNITDFIEKTQQLGEKEFEGKESNSFWKLYINQWNKIFFKHFGHHLNQFGI